MVELDIWIEKVQRAEYLAEDELKALCEYVRSTYLALQFIFSSPSAYHDCFLTLLVLASLSTSR
jgi:hypothetical protein